MLNIIILFLRETDLLVTPDNVDELNKFYNGITVGTLLLNYDTRDDILPINNKDLTLGTAQFGLSLLSAYEYTGDSKYKEFVDDYYSYLFNMFENYNGTFYGEYTIDGKKGTGVEITIEIVNTGFYLKLSRLMNVYNHSSFVDTILDAILKNNNSYALNGWAWDYSSEAFYIEALSSAVLSEELNLCFKNTIVISDNKSNDDIIADNTDEENNPNTSTNRIMMYIS